MAGAKKSLQTLATLAVDHLMNEDISFYRLMKEQGRVDEELEELIAEFKDTFKGVKTTLMNFLSKYSRPDIPLDADFFDTFNTLVGILAERIKFEEKNLYSKLSAS
jgi:hypothetical protein